MNSDTIHFECPNCGKHFRCSSELAGKQVKCPNAQCGAELIVPSPQPTTPAVGTPPPPMHLESVDSTPGQPQAFEPSSNPYQSPDDHSHMGADGQPRKAPPNVKAPGIALIVVGVLNSIYAIINGFANLTEDGGAEPVPPEFQDNEFMREFWVGMNEPAPVVGIVISVLMAVAAVLIIVGGVKMMNMSSYPLAVIAAILSMVPCVTCLGCCGLGQAVGIWALVVLLNEDVRSGFQ